MNGIPFFARQPILKSLTVFAILVACLTGCSSSSDEQVTENSESQVEETDQSSATGSTEEETDQATKEDTSSEENTPAPPSEQNEETESDDTEEQADPEPSEQDEEETPTEKPAQRIEFTTDDIGTIIEGGILRGDASPVYVLRASAQQLMQLTLISLEDNASLDVVAPNGEKLVTDIKRTKILLPADGDYLIYINPLRGNVSYSLDVLITNIVEYIPVEFAAGTSSTIISGGMLRGETGPVYGLVAAAGQRMEVAITSLEENA